MSETGESAPARPTKSAAAFRTIGEVADDLDLPTHVLRFWESKFPQLKPLKRGGGRRYYRPEDIVLLRRIRQCLYQEGYTIRGVQKLLGGGTVATSPTSNPATPSLFPLDGPADGLLAAPDEPVAPAKPPRRPRQPRPQPEKADSRAALEEIRRELLEARALLDDLLPSQKPQP